jgi:hypothetical protein
VKSWLSIITNQEAVYTVVLRATRGSAVGAVLGVQQGMAARRPADLHWRGGSDTSVARAGYYLPFAAHVAADLDHRNPASVDLFAHFLSTAALASYHRGAVVVHANLFRLVLGAVAGVIQKRRVTAGNRCAPGDKRRGLIAGRNADGIGAANGN